MDVKGKNVFITGAAQGLGKAYAEAFLETGGKVFFGDINAETGAATLKLLEKKYGSDKVKFQPFDVTEKKDFEGAFQQAVDSFGHIDILVNNAGIVNERQYEQCINVNFTAVVFGTYLATEHMRKDKGGKGGRIVNIGSVVGLDMHPAAVRVYCGTKTAIKSFTICMANQKDVEKLGVEYGVLCPAASDTALIRSLNEEVSIQLSEERKKEIMSSAMPVQRVAVGMLELLTQEKMNGAILFVDDKKKNYRKMSTESSEIWKP